MDNIIGMRSQITAAVAAIFTVVVALFGKQLPWLTPDVEKVVLVVLGSLFSLFMAMKVSRTAGK